ncbi:MAG: lamin tail domain-containing protein [Paludibacter sp.]|nr:lamin tail domain-containing protein [Paludibacter sp.]
MKKESFIKFMLLAVIMLVVGSGVAWGATVTYTISDKNTLTTSGTAPSGSSATMVETYSTSKQMTSGNSQTLTLSSHYSGYKITSITLSMRSNTSGGSGNFIYKINGGEDNSIVATNKFNNAAWYGAWSTSYVNITKAVDITCGSTSTVLKIAATANSLYCQSYSLTYEASSSCTPLGTPTVTPTAGNTEATLLWGAVANASSYTLIWNGGSPETVTSPVTKTGLTNGVSYSYSVMAVGDGTTYCETNTAATGNVTPVAPPPPAAPTATSATSVTSSGFTANWNAVSGATGYRLDIYKKVGGGNATDLFISEYIEGSSNNKAIEIYNGTGSSVDLSIYSIRKQANGAGSFGGDLPLSGTLANGEVYVIAHSLSNETILEQADQTAGGTPIDFNGNDAVALYKNGIQIDVVGVVDQVASWGADVTLVRKPSISEATTSYSISDWDPFESETYDYLGSHTFSGGSSQTYVSGFEDHDAGNVTSKAITSLDASTDYFYVVRAYNGSVTSASSNEISVTTSAGASPLISVSPATLTGFTYAQGSGPSAEQSFTVSAVNLTNDISIAATTNYEISKTSGSGYTTPLTFTQSDGTVTEQTVYVRLKSGLTQGTYNDEVINITSTGATTKTVTASGSVTAAPIAEPSNHATGFTATTNSTTEITVTWTDASGGADSYLVKGSSVSAESITTPVDGTAEADATLVKNIASGVQSATFTGLTASTTYYFKVFPYNGTGAEVNYKTDGSVPTTNTTTATPLIAPTATAATGILTDGFTANWGAVSGATSYDVNVYTKTAGGSTTQTENFDGITPDSEGKIISVATYLSGWSVSSQGTLRQIYTTATNFGASSPSLAFTTTGDYIETATYASPIQEFSFWVKQQGGATSSTLIEGYNGSTWTTIATLSNADVATADTKTYDLISLGKTDVVKIKMTYTKSVGNLSIDDVAVTYGGSTNTPITNSPFNVTSATTKELTGLSSGTAYYYTVVAKDATSSSDASNEITVITAIDGTLDASTLPDCPTCDLVVNNGGVVTLNAGKSYNSVSVKPGAKLTLNDGQTFAPGTFVLESNASATATFVDKRSNANKTNITATVKRHLPAASTRTWWYLASPVDGASYTVFGSNKVGDYSETTRSYSNPFTEATTLTAGKGYVVKMTAAEATDYIFADNILNTGNISVPLTRTVTVTADNAKRGFNLVGNPYPSYIDWDYVYLEGVNVRPTIWYRTLNGTSMEFHTYNAELGVGSPTTASEYIPPMQAFWVKVDTDPTEGSVSNGTLNFTNDMRSHDESVDGNPLKTPAADRNLVRLSISNGTLSDETVIVTHPSASDNYDRFDSEKMANGDTNRPEIFSMAGNQELVINGISPLTDSKQIALGVRPGRAGNYTISLTEWRNTGNMEAVLRDNQLGEELILTESSSYSFDTDGSTSTSRFSLLFRAKGSTTGFDRISSDLLIYASQKSIRVESASLEGNTISIFNALGQPVFNGKAQSNRLEINGLTPAVYMVKVNNQTKMVIVK